MLSERLADLDEVPLMGRSAHDANLNRLSAALHKVVGR